MKDYLKPWTPVKVEKKGNTLSAEMWGRKYEFDNSFMPTQIISQGQEMLYAPVKLTPVFFDKEGEWHDVSLDIFSENDEEAVIITTAECDNVLVDSAITVECDGFVKIDLKVMSHWQFSSTNTPRPKLTGLYMDIPVKKEYATLMHYWPNDKTSIIPSGKVMNSGATREAVFPFKPYVSLGNEEVGVGIYCGDSPENYLLNDEDKCISITDEGEYINVRVRFLDQMPKNWQGRDDRWVSALKPILYSVGFHATPVKPMRKNDETYKIYHWGDCDLMKVDGKMNYEVINTLADAGVKWVILHENWTGIQNYGFPLDEKFTKDFIAECHGKGMKVMVYFGYEFSTLNPAWHKHADDYLIKTADNEYCGGWQRKPHQRAYMVCYNGDYSDVMLDRVKYVMDELGVDGIYTDGTYIPWECANKDHGCGYINSKGEFCPSFPVMPVREHVKKLYKVVHERGGIVDAHQSSCCVMPTLSFCDSYYDGENIQGMLSKDNLDFLSMPSFRAEYMGTNFGIPTNFIAYTNDDRPIEALEALTLLHNVHCRVCSIHAALLRDLGYVSSIWKIFDKYDLDNAEWIPYWRNTETPAEGEKAYASLYKAKAGDVVFAAHFAYGKDEMKIKLPEGAKTATNIATGEEYKVENSCLTIKTKSAIINMLLIK